MKKECNRYELEGEFFLLERSADDQARYGIIREELGSCPLREAVQFGYQSTPLLYDT
jgi:hypothetical protein